MSKDLDEARQRYRMNYFKYDCKFTAQYDQEVRQQRQYVDLQPALDAQSGRLLSFLIRLMQAKNVLELGTSIGYSAHWLAKALDETNGKLITIDFHLRTGKEAQSNFEKSGIYSRVEFINDDIEKVLPTLDQTFDLIFVDCGKSFYPKIIEKLYPLLRVGGLLAIDDTLLSFEKNVRHSLIKNIDIFNQQLHQDERFYPLMLDIGHGLTLAIKSL